MLIILSTQSLLTESVTLPHAAAQFVNAGVPATGCVDAPVIDFKKVWNSLTVGKSEIPPGREPGTRHWFINVWQFALSVPSRQDCAVAPSVPGCKDAKIP